MSWTDIVNKGSSSWWVVQNNQPVGAGSFCNAVPDVDDWQTLSDWKSAGYRFPLTRKAKVPLVDYEIKPIDIEFVLKWEYGNQYRGKGMFLRTIWTEVNKCEVWDGFDVSLAFRCSAPWNDNPNGKPPWPAARIDLEITGEIRTPNWTKQVDKWKLHLSYTGGLEIR
jgi:hypothetical protein